MSRQNVVREYELFVSAGVHEVPESVFEREARSAGELRVVRESKVEPNASKQRVLRVEIGKVLFRKETGEVID